MSRLQDEANAARDLAKKRLEELVNECLTLAASLQRETPAQQLLANASGLRATRLFPVVTALALAADFERAEARRKLEEQSEARHRGTYAITYS
jgi:hypothetical protein